MENLKIENNSLIYVYENKSYKVKNAFFNGASEFHLVHGWYVDQNPVDITKNFEIDIIDDNICRIIREV